MPDEDGRGNFSRSIDLTPPTEEHYQTELDRVFQLLRKVKIPATITTPEPVCSKLVERLHAEPLRHEIALLADGSWAGPQAGRTQFSRELARRVSVAKSQGATIRTIAVADAELNKDLDLLVKHRISVVRSPANAGFHAQSLRFGVWQAPISFRSPLKGRWRFSGTEWAVTRALSRANQTSCLVHVVVDVATLGDPDEFASLGRILATAQRRRQKGTLATVTMQGLVARMAPQRRAISAQSVLRVA